MALQYKFFVINASHYSEAETELNQFLKSSQVVNIQKEFVSHGQSALWYYAVEYITNDGKTKSASKSKIDYKEVLSPADFAIFAKLREWRKAAAEKEAVPVYIIFTNEQLAKIAEKRITTKEGLNRLNGVGESRIKNYGEAVIQIVKQQSQARQRNLPT